LVKKLSKINKKMIIGSSGFPRIIKYVYQKLNLNKYMEEFIDINKINNGKPNLEIFLQAANALNTNPKNCIVVEDSENGIKAAKNAGMKCVAYNGRNSNFQNLELADFIINKYNDENFKKIFNNINLNIEIPKSISNLSILVFKLFE